MMGRVRRRAVSRVVLGTALAVVVVGCGAEPSNDEPGQAGTEQEKSPQQVRLAPEALQAMDLHMAIAEEREFSQVLVVAAELTADPDRRAVVSPRVAGRVEEVRVTVGDRVARGTPLVVLESREAGTTRADLVAAVARMEVARRAYQRKQGLYESRVTSLQEVEAAEGALRIAEADVAAIRARLATFGLPSDTAGSPGKPSRIVLSSPMAGTVVSRSVYVGRYVEPMEAVLEIVNLDEVWLLASVYERDLHRVAAGQAVQVDVRACPGEVFTGTVAHVGDVLEEQSRAAKVRVVLPNRDHRLKPGMFATARIRGTPDAGRRALLIPWAAVHLVEGEHFVFVRMGDRTFEVRRVRVGERAGEEVEVLAGLTAGTVVAAEGSFVLKGELLKSTLGDID